MPVPVRLDFVPPSEPDIVSLKIWESSERDTGYIAIETVPAGTYPNYLSYHVTQLATSLTDWFAISWISAGGAESELSQPIQGGTTTLVAKIASRVLLREPTMDERIANQAAEFVISKVKHTEDPYDPLLTATYAELEGLTLLALARTLINSAALSAAESQSYTAGLVSQKADSGLQQKLVDYVKLLVAEANRALGISLTIVMVLEDIDPTGLGDVSTVGIDQSRLMLEI